MPQPRAVLRVVGVLSGVSFCIMMIYAEWNGKPTMDVDAEKKEYQGSVETTRVTAADDNRTTAMDNLALLMENKARGSVDSLKTPSGNYSSQEKNLTVNEYKKVKAEQYIKKYANPANKRDISPTLTTFGPNMHRQNPHALIKDTTMSVQTEQIKEVLAKEIKRRMDLGDSSILEIPEVQKEIEENPTSVPNIVHLVWFSCHRYKVHHFTSMMSALRIQKPRAILLHTNCVPSGEYWDVFVKEAGPKLKIMKRTPPTKVWSREVKVVEHQSDVARLEILLEVGGIYMDSDTILLKSLDPLRKHEMVMGEQREDSLGNGILLVNRDSWFMKRWYQEYRSFQDSIWSQSSCLLPWAMWHFFPSKIYVVKEKMLRPNGLEVNYIYQQLFDWSNNYSIHLYARYMEKSDGTSERSLKDLAILNTTYGEISRYVLWGDKKPRDISFLM